jgi:hypothetical protein
MIAVPSGRGVNGFENPTKLWVNEVFEKKRLLAVQIEKR